MTTAGPDMPPRFDTEVLIVGAGFAGLWAAKELRHSPLRVTMFSRRCCTQHGIWHGKRANAAVAWLLMKRRTKGQIEAEISEAVIKFEKEYMGRGPLETKAYLVDDMVLVRLKGAMTPAEYQLVKTADSSRGRELIKQTRCELLERGRALLEAVVESITGRRVITLHSDISTVLGERVVIFGLDAPPDFESTEPRPRPRSASADEDSA